MTTPDESGLITLQYSLYSCQQSSPDFSIPDLSMYDHSSTIESIGLHHPLDVFQSNQYIGTIILFKSVYNHTGQKENVDDDIITFFAVCLIL